MLHAAVTALRERWPAARMTDAVRLRGSERTMVWRVRLGTDAKARSAPPATVVVKVYTVGERRTGGWIREAAALATLTKLGVADAPLLLAESTDPLLVVMTDAGDGTDLATILLGDDRPAARRGLLAWAAAVADLHVATRHGGEVFARQLARRADGEAPAPDPMPAECARAADVLAEQLPGLGVRPSAAVLGELPALAAVLAAADETAALTPADTCPDNNVLTSDRMVLLDYEGAQFRHVAWDVAYLSVPWPSCWCSWLLPDTVAREAVGRYRARAGAGIPYVTSPEFERDVVVATLGWAFLTAAWFLPNAAVDPPVEPPIVAPFRRQLVQHRLRAAAGLHLSEFPALTALAAECADATVEAWGHRPLPLAPAWLAGAGDAEGDPPVEWAP
jgi:hypothetical protein